MKKFLKIIAGLILFVLVIRMCGGSESAPNESDSISQNSESLEELESKPTVSKEELQTELANEKKKLAASIKNFDFEEDEFTGDGWYKHKLFNVNRTYNRTLLSANVHKSGRAYLVSNYYGDDWIFHESITVKIDDRVITSETIPSYDENNVRENGSGSVWETIHFTNERDNGILSAVGANPEKTIKVRLHGRQYKKDYTLIKNDKQAIADCLTLSRLLKSVKEKETAIAIL